MSGQESPTVLGEVRALAEAIAKDREFTYGRCTCYECASHDATGRPALTQAVVYAARQIHPDTLFNLLAVMEPMLRDDSLASAYLCMVDDADEPDVADALERLTEPSTVLGED